MKKVFYIGKTIYNRTTNSYLSNSVRYLSTQTFELTKRPLKVEKEYKFIKADIVPSVISDRKIATIEDWKAIRDKLLKSECLKLLEEIKISSDPGAGAYSAIASSAFTNGENELGWKLLNEAISDKNRSPLPRSYLSYLEQCEKISSVAAFVVEVEKLFEFFKQHDIKCDDEVAENIDRIYKKFNRNPKITRIDARGSCLNCKQKLNKFELSQNEFENLKNAILKNVIVGKNVFYRTTPSELKHFQEFVADMKQYDVVIDGLNVAYCIGTKQSPSIFVSLLASVVKHFASHNKKILVLGRTHMQKWPRKNWNYITENADTFLAESLSQDDPYLLYCALNSGLNTIIVTKDLMRSHLFKLKDPKLKVLFNQWLMQSQYQLKYVDNRGRVFFKYPLPYIRTPQKHKDCWHLPLIEDYESSQDKWLCLK
ncbi:hypothetical protein ILUMI_03642 [Ignelater luminosus]|uniref:PRORP domain-containing protein n=1 Tax=Ignelater luminosus TaxID=2038154 RepID=A0A8K0DG67_IGNLU|nr:hypothetical protein ILUMI_03642 [Ignelater luminosus]